MPTIFTRIIHGEIPSARVYEDEYTLAFMDINPAAKGHTLVICKEEYPGLLDMPPELVTAVAHTTQRVARAIVAALKPDGFNIVQNDGAAAGQVVFHYHVHIVPRWHSDGVTQFLRENQSRTEDLATLAQHIKEHII